MLYAPESYWKATPEERNEVINGCGTSDWKGHLVPEKLLGLSVSESCNIHDWMYHHGEDDTDKEKADSVFLNNMQRTIDSETNNYVLKKLRLRKAKLYHHAVSYLGGPAFWASKSKSNKL